MAQDELKYFQVGLATFRCLKIKCMEVNKHKRSTRKYNEKVPKIPTFTCDRQSPLLNAWRPFCHFPVTGIRIQSQRVWQGKWGLFYFYHDTQCPPPRICTHCTIIHIFQRFIQSHPRKWLNQGLNPCCLAAKTNLLTMVLH